MDFATKLCSWSLAFRRVYPVVRFVVVGHSNSYKHICYVDIKLCIYRLKWSATNQNTNFSGIIHRLEFCILYTKEMFFERTCQFTVRSTVIGFCKLSASDSRSRSSPRRSPHWSCCNLFCGGKLIDSKVSSWIPTKYENIMRACSAIKF